MDLTADIAARLEKMNEALKTAELSVQKHTAIFEDGYSELSPAEKAEHDLMSVYTLLSLYWGLLRVRGIDPKQYELKKDFERVQEGLKKVRELKDKSKAPQVNKVAAERFVRRALWEAKTTEVVEGSEEPVKKKVRGERN